jgi:hypothetical protein
MNSLTILETYHLTVLIIGIGTTIKSLELIFISNSFKPHSMSDWEVVGVDAMIESRFSNIFRKIYSQIGMILLCCASIVSFGLTLLFFNNPTVYNCCVAILFICHFLIHHRQGFGGDGADQMLFLILTTLFLTFVVVDNTSIKNIGVVFIASQLILSYFVSGVAKLVSPQWRSGIAIDGILSSYTYGTMFTRKIFSNNKWLSTILCWYTMLLESLFPFCIFMGNDIFFTFLLLGLSLHIFIGVLMGLNDFIWSFSAAYPSLVYVYMNLLKNIQSFDY